MSIPDIANLLDRLPQVRRSRRQRRLARMRKALFALSPLHLSVFRMMRLEGLSVAQVARKLHLPPQRIEALLIEVIIALAEAARP